MYSYTFVTRFCIHLQKRICFGFNCNEIWGDFCWRYKQKLSLWQKELKKEVSQGNKIVAVVSAMSGETDKLIRLVESITTKYMPVNMILLYHQENRLPLDY